MSSLSASCCSAHVELAQFIMVHIKQLSFKFDMLQILRDGCQVEVTFLESLMIVFWASHKFFEVMSSKLQE